MSHVYVFMGRPGSGKGTQAKLFAEKIRAGLFSLGRRHREVAQNDTYLGRKVKKEIDAGNLSPYWFATYLVQDILFNASETKSIIFDGSNRKKHEAELFNDMMEWLERTYTVVYLDVGEDELRTRLAKRKADSNRADDDPEDITRRINEYDEHTMPAIEFLKTKTKVVDINGEQPVEKIFKDICEKLEIS